MRQGMLLVCLGLIVGTVGALLGTRFIKALMFGVSTTDPMVFLVDSVVLLASAALFAWIPARRAAHVDPAAMLGGE